jgi:hypothetical protein
MSIRNRFVSWRLNMGGFGSGSFDPKTLAIVEAAFDETWLTLKFNGNHKVRAEELARCILRLATEGERDPMRLHDRALAALVPAMAWRDPDPSVFPFPISASVAEPEQDFFQHSR